MIVAFRRVLGKEFRALLAVWIAGAAAIVAARVGFPALALPAYVAGAAALGAFSIGHEYTYRTSALLLAQPSRRGLLFGAKGIALVASVIALAFVARIFAINWNAVHNAGTPGRLLADASLVIPAALAICAAPWFTMLSRSVLGGTVFTIAVPAAALVLGQWLGVALHGYDNGADTVAIRWVFGATTLIAAVGAIESWRRFRRLEVVDYHASVVRVPRLHRFGHVASWTGRSSQRPIAALIVKEVRLQQLSIVLAAMYAVAALLAAPFVTPYSENASAVLTLFYAVTSTVLIGALASAEERQLGTVESQLLLPLPAWKQWMVKLSVVFGLVLTLSWGVPVIAGYLAPALVLPATAAVFHRSPFLLLLFVTLSLSVYASSLTSAGVRAFPIALATVFGLLGALNLLEFVVLRRVMSPPPGGYGRLMFYALGITAIPPLWFAFANHRYADRNGKRIVIQGASLIVILIVALAVVRAVL